MQANSHETDLWFLYLLRCQNGNYYVGISQDVQTRVEQHCRGHGALYTKIHGVERLVGCVEMGSRVEAARMEKRIKCWSPERKKSLLYSLRPARRHPPSFRTQEEEIMTKLWNALAIHVLATEQKTKAEAEVWEALKAQAPDLCVAISYLIQDETQAARWVCHPNADYEGSPAHLVARGADRRGHGNAAS